MTYRLHEHKHHEPRRTLVDTATPSRIYVHNGTIAHLAFPCWYQETHKPIHIRPHHRLLHDHYGWPAPDNPDHICQVWVPGPHEPVPGVDPRHIHVHKLIDLSMLTPIHLFQEGYNITEVAFNANRDPEHAIEALDPYARIDEQEDWVIRVDLNVNDEDALFEPRVYRMSVFVGYRNEDTGDVTERDLAVLTEVVVLPSSYPYSPELPDDEIIDS